MIKILYIDTSLDGHHKKYLQELNLLNNDNEIKTFLLIPQKIEIDNVKQYEIKSGFDKKRTIFTYIKFINEIKIIANDNNIDIIHFLSGDALYRYFGIMFSKLKQKVIITYHHMIFKGIKKISIKNIFKRSSIGIVHTQELYNNLQKNNIRNAYLVDYPMLDCISRKTTEEAKRYFKLPLDIPILGMIGGTSKYKGLDFLIKALNNIDLECCLFVAGNVHEYDENFIKDNLTNEKVKLITTLRRLTDEEFADAIQASDTIMLPYRLEFDGASGILIESLFHNKHVIGSNHGSMGDLIRTYELGRTFETNNLEDLIDKIKKDFINPYKLSNKSNEYREKLSSDRFLKLNKEIYNICMK